MRVQMRMNYEMNRQLQSDNDLSLADYHVLNALTGAPGERMQVSDLAALIGWGLQPRVASAAQAMRARPRRTGAITERWQSDRCDLTKAGREMIEAAAPGHAALVRRLFFESLHDELLCTLTAALEHIHVNINFNGSLPPPPW